MCELLSDIYLMTSIILCLLRFGFWASRCSLCWFPHVPVFSMPCACVFCFCGWCDLQPSRLFMVLFMGFVVFCLLILPITERGILHSPTIIVCLFVLSFLLVFALCILKFLLRWLVKISLLNVLFFYPWWYIWFWGTHCLILPILLKLSQLLFIYIYSVLFFFFNIDLV